jgi:subtilase family serine protease
MHRTHLLLTLLISIPGTAVFADYIDLVIHNIQVEEDILTVGDEIDIRFEVINIGNAAAFPRGNDIESRVYLSTDKELDRDEDILLAEDEERTSILWPWGMNDNFFDTEAGYHFVEEIPEIRDLNRPWGATMYLIFDIDSDNSVRESDESNVFVLNQSIRITTHELGEPFEFSGDYQMDEFPWVYSEESGWVFIEPDRDGFWIYQRESDEWSFTPSEGSIWPSTLP